MDTAQETSSPPAFDLAQTPLREGSMLIEASAGTGKTYTLVGLILRLILEQHRRVTEILVVTFTNAATAELREKVRANLVAVKRFLETGEDPEGDVPEFIRALAEEHPERHEQWVRALDRALVEFNDAAIRTIHGFCQSVLQEQAFETGALFQSELMGDCTDLLQEVLLDFWRRTFYPMEPHLAGILLSKQKRFEGQASTARSREETPFSRQTLEDLLRGWGRHPDARLPEGENAFAGIEEALEALENDLQKLHTAATADREELHKIFLEKRDWGTQDYGKNKDKLNAQRLEQLRHCLESPAQNAISDWEILTHFRRHNITTLCNKSAIKNDTTPPCLTTFKAVENLLETRSRAIFTLKTEFIKYLDQEMLVRGEQRNIFTYDSLLTEVDRALQRDAGSLLGRLRERYRVVLIDEFQDTDALQYRIFRKLFEADDRMMVMVGDPKQSIYRFRGADVNTYLRAARQAGERFTLKQNFRSDAALVDGFNRLFTQPHMPFALPEVAYLPVESGLGTEKSRQLTLAEDENPARLRIGIALQQEELTIPDIEQWAEDWAVEEIARLIKGGARIDGRPVTSGDIAILAHKGKHLRRMQKRLNALGIPSAMRTTSSIWATDEARILEHVLRAIVEMGDPSLIRSALTTPLCGLNATQLAELTTDDNAWESVCEEFRLYHELWEKRGFIQMFNRLLTQREVRRRLAAQLDGLRSLTNYDHLAELLHDQARREDLGKTRLLTWLQEKRRDPRNADGEDTSERLRIESDEPSLTLMTIHGSKGLQFPIVLCPFLWNDHTPGGPKRQESFYFDPDEAAYFWNLEEELPERLENGPRLDHLSENLRLLYVALTRAQHQCSFFAGKLFGKNKIYGQSLPYLLHQDPAWAAECDDALELLDRSLENLQNLEPTQVRENLEQALRTRDPGCPIAALPFPRPVEKRRELSVPPATQEYAAEDLQAREFTGKISRDWGVSSFTALKKMSKHGDAPPEAGSPVLDEVGEDLLDTDSTIATPQAEPEDEQPESAADIFTLPAGARTGSMLHEILENLDFHHTGGWETVVAKSLAGYGFEQKRFAPAILKMLQELVNLPLPKNPGQVEGGESFRLRDLDPNQVRREMEFALPLPGFWLPHLKSVFTGDAQDQNPEWWNPFTRRLENLAPRQLQGFLRGFIDLIFSHEGRYYIIDWKSNLLGSAKSAYQGGKLPRIMVEDLYLLQYHLYAVAAVRYLRQRLPDFSFADHFGGVFYIFLRGLDATWPGNGVFSDRPPEKRILALDELLKKGGSG